MKLTNQKLSKPENIGIRSALEELADLIAPKIILREPPEGYFSAEQIAETVEGWTPELARRKLLDLEKKGIIESVLVTEGNSRRKYFRKKQNEEAN